MTRRSLLWGGGGLAGLAALGTAGYLTDPGRLLTRAGLKPAPKPFIPDAPAGVVRVQQVASQARGKTVDLFTAVPAGYGDGAGLPVVVVLHGASATVSQFPGFGLARFVTQAVREGAAPFVLAGADGGRLSWEPHPGDDPRAMIVDELPSWLADRGFDATRRAVWGWSMGGYGALRLAVVEPGWARATAVFSPAVRRGDAVFTGAKALRGNDLGLWCGRQDSFYPAVTHLIQELPSPPKVASFTDGAHTRVYWNEHTVAAFAFLAERLVT